MQVSPVYALNDKMSSHGFESSWVALSLRWLFERLNMTGTLWYTTQEAHSTQEPIGLTKEDLPKLEPHLELQIQNPAWPGSRAARNESMDDLIDNGGIGAALTLGLNTRAEPDGALDREGCFAGCITNP